MEILIQILSVIVAILLIVVVLIQKSKGGGLSSSFAGSNQIMGVRRTNDFIEKATWTLASIICVLAIVSAIYLPNAQSGTSAKSLENLPQQQPAQGGQYDTKANAGEAKDAAKPAEQATEQKTQEAAPTTEAAPKQTETKAEAPEAKATPAPAEGK